MLDLMAIEDVVVELNRLQADGTIASYAIGGAIGSFAYIETTNTVDVDVFVVVSASDSNSLQPLRSIYTDLLSRGAKQEREHLVIGGWPVQFLMAGPLHDAAISSARTIPLGSQDARIMGPEYLAAIALETGRGKDHVRLLEFIRTGTIDMALFVELVEQFELTEKWKKFQARFLSDNDKN